MPPTTSTPLALDPHARAQLLDRARAALGEIAPALRHISTDELAARAQRLVDGIRRHAGQFLTDARTAAGDAATSAATNAENLVAERLTARIRAKVAPPIQAAVVIALLALLVALIALYRTRGRP